MGLNFRGVAGRTASSPPCWTPTTSTKHHSWIGWTSVLYAGAAVRLLLPLLRARLCTERKGTVHPHNMQQVSNADGSSTLLRSWLTCG